MKKHNTYPFLIFITFYLFPAIAVNAQVAYQIKTIDKEIPASEWPLRTVEAGPIDLQVNSNFYAIPPNALWPAQQLECFGFLADVQNNSNEVATGVNLNISIVEDNSGQNVYSEDLPYNSIPGGTLVGNIPFPDCYTPPGSLRNYTGTYTISSDSIDNNLGNNSQSFSFETTLGTFSKETGATNTLTPIISDNENQSWAWGCYYYVVNGCPTVAEEVSFGIGNAADVSDRLLTISLYEWVEDLNQDDNMDPNEREKVGFAIYEIQGSEQETDIITIPLNTFPTNQWSVELKNETAYVLMLEYLTIDNTKLFLSASNEYDYTAQVYLSTLGDKPRYAAMLGIGADLESETYESVGFGMDLVPVARLHINTIIDNIDDVLDEANIITVSPNPAKEVISINLELVEKIPEAQIRIMDITGQVMIKDKVKNVQDVKLSFDISHFTAGTYFFQFLTEEGSRTERFVKVP